MSNIIIDEETPVVEEIVEKWNMLVTNTENNTIKLCLMIKEILKNYPEDKIIDIIQRVKTHPHIKRFISIDRIYQGIRLINERNDLIEYHQMTSDERQTLPEDKKPYTKVDGEVFWEFYFELHKQPFSNGVVSMMEMEAKKEKWSYRDLKEKISDFKMELDHPIGFEGFKKERNELFKSILNLMKSVNNEALKETKNDLLTKYRSGNYSLKRKD